MNRPLIIYHGNCADGFSAAWCFWKRFGDNADYVAGVYQQDPPEVSGRNVFLVDFSYKRAVIEAMLKAGSTITLIDHHKTAIEDLQTIEHPRFFQFTSLERSGAVLAWDFLFPDAPRPLLLEHVQDRDLWQFKLPGTREIQAYLFSHEYTFTQWDRMMSADQVELLKMTEAGAAIERKHHKDIAELLKVCRRTMVISGIEVPVASLPYTMSSDAGHIMAADAPFAACYYDSADGRNFSLRSRPEGMDVSEIAKSYGGGGHKHASGFQVPRDHELARA